MTRVIIPLNETEELIDGLHKIRDAEMERFNKKDKNVLFYRKLRMSAADKAVEEIKKARIRSSMTVADMAVKEIQKARIRCGVN